MTIQDRITLLIENLGLSKNEFARQIGISSSLISQITKRGNNFSVDVLLKIFSTFPSINKDWLLNGIGEMYNLSGEIAGGEKAGEKVKRNAGVFTKTENEAGSGIVQDFCLRFSGVKALELKMLIAAHTGRSVEELMPLHRYESLYAEHLLMDRKESEQTIRSLLAEIRRLLSIYNDTVSFVKDYNLADPNNDFLNAKEWPYKAWKRDFFNGFWDESDFEEPQYHKTENKNVNRALLCILLEEERESLSRGVIDGAYKFNHLIYYVLVAKG